MTARVSCVICAYNEAERIGDVLSVVQDHPLVDEVIVVDDGSTDDTDDVVRAFQRIQLLTQPTNMGKSRALVRGVEATTGQFVMTLDADLQNLTSENITALITPVTSGAVDVSISVRGNSLTLYKAVGLDFVSGERVFPRALVAEYAEEIRNLSRFGVESFMNERIIERRLTISIVKLGNVINTRKAQKEGWLKGTWAELRMIADIMSVLSPLRVVRQIYVMLQLSRKH